MLLGFDHHNGPLKDDIEGGRGFEAADEFLQVPMRKPRSKSVRIFIYCFESSKSFDSLVRDG